MLYISMLRWDSFNGLTEEAQGVGHIVAINNISLDDN